MKINITLTIIIAFCFGLFSSSCRELIDEKYISEGIIEYQVTYPKSNDAGFMAGLMPETMYFKFKKDKIALDLSGGMGMFKTSFVSDFENHTLLQLVKMMNKKYAILFHSTEIDAMNNEIPKMNIEFVDAKKVIAGYECKKAVITFPDDKNVSFDVFYTNDINLKTPNWSTQYKEIDGVLMEYQMTRYNIEMKFTAKYVVKQSIEDSDFEIPEDYKIISRKEMDNLFSNFN